MQHSHRLPISSDPLPPCLRSRLAGFVDLFTRPTWSNVLVLLAGVILAPGRRTVTAALRILGPRSRSRLLHLSPPPQSRSMDVARDRGPTAAPAGQDLHTLRNPG